MKKELAGFVFIILSFVFLGVGNLFYKKSTTLIGPVNTAFFYYLFSLILAGIIWFYFREPISIEPAKLIWAGLLAIFLTASVICYAQALKHLDMAIASTIRSLAFVVSVVLAVIFLKEELAAKDVVAVILAVCSIILFGMK